LSEDAPLQPNRQVLGRLAKESPAIVFNLLQQLEARAAAAVVTAPLICRPMRAAISSWVSSST
jgi:hypothetical protein